MEHHFDVALATEYGILEAVLLNHLYFWISQNEGNGVNFHDGRYWTYNSTKAFSELFPYVTRRKIQIALDHLKEEGLIETGNYNTVAYDRTLWYSLTDKGMSMCKNVKCISRTGAMDDAEMCNAFNAEVQPIPDNKPDNIPYTTISKREGTNRFIPPTVDEVAAYCKERGNSIDPQAFVDFYESKGWKVGGTPMKDFKAAVRTWEHRQRNNNPASSNSNSSFDTDEFFQAALRRYYSDKQ